MGKQVKTVLNKELYQIFEAYKINNNCETDYMALRHLIMNINNVSFNQPTVLTGNVSQDDKMLDDMERSGLESWLRDLEKKGAKEKNLIKKNGAFHNMNYLVDIKTLIAGEPDLYEMKYHVDWWYNVQALSRALARKGVKSNLIDSYVESYKFVKPTGLSRELLKNRIYH